MKKPLRIALRIAAIFAVVAVLAVVTGVLLIRYDQPLVKGLVEKAVNKRPGLSVGIGRLDYRFFPLRLRLEKLDAAMTSATMDVRAKIDSVEVTGDLKKLWKKKKPALDYLHIGKAAITVKQKAVSPEPTDYAALVRMAADYLGYLEALTVEKAEITYAMPGFGTSLADLGMKIKRDGGRNAYWIELQSERVRAYRDDGSFAFDSGLRVDGTVALYARTSAVLKLALDRPNIRTAVRPTPFGFGSVAAGFEAVWDTKTGRVDVLQYALAVASKQAFRDPKRDLVEIPENYLNAYDLVEVAGTASASLGAGPSFETRSSLKAPSIAALIAMAGDMLPKEMKGTKLDGGVAADVHFKRTGDRNEFEADISVDKGIVETVQAGIPVRASFDVKVKANGLPLEFKADGRLQASVPGISRDAMSVGRTSIAAEFSATRTGVEVKKFSAEAASVVYALADGKKIALGKVGLSGRGRMDMNDGTAELDGLEMTLTGFPPARLSGRVGLGDSPTGRFSFETRGIEVQALRALAAPFIPPAYEGWGAAGALDVVLEAEGRRGADRRAAWNISAMVAGKGFSFNDPDFTIAGDKLDPTLTIKAAYMIGSDQVPFSAEAGLLGGECLFKDFYIDWAKHNLKVVASGSLLTAGKGLDGLSVKADLPGIGAVDMSGKASFAAGPEFSITAGLKLALAPLLSLYSQSGTPAESRTSISGELSGEMGIEGRGKAIDVTGVLRVADMGLENPASKLIAAGITAEVPFEAGIGGDGPTAGGGAAADKKKGRIVIGELSHPMLSLKGLEIDLLTSRNSFEIEPIGIDLFGGKFELLRTTFAFSPETSSFAGRSGLRITALNLAKLPSPSPQIRLSGLVNLDLPSLEISPEKIDIQGNGEIGIFGGSIVLTNFQVTRPFAESRRVSLDVAIKEIDLKKMTDAVPFGEVTGIVSGEVRGLSFAYGQPESFYFRLETVPRRGVPKTFSLKAVDNLTIISSGETASVGSSSPFWMRFVRGFRYSKLGIVSSLRNDTFTLNGTIKEGGVEYLVKKPPFFGINVINRMPDKRISFKEMMDRLGRVGRSESPS